jgi:hypothetical protein
MHKKSQFWYTDFIIGLTIVLLISILFFSVTREITARQYTMNQLVNSGVSISSSLMSQGADENRWKQGEGRIGLLTVDYKIDEDKLRRFQDLTEDDYKTSKYLLGVQEDYAVYFEYVNPEEMTEARSYVYGKPGTEPEQISGQNVRITRYVYYKPQYDPDYQGADRNGQIARMVVAVWKE